MSQKIKNKIRSERMNTVFGQIFELREAGIEIFELTSFQYRLIRENHIIDYFPTSGKYHDISKDTRGFILPQDILTLFRQTHFKNKIMNDESLMPFGKYKGEKLANVPPEYLIWLYENNKCYGDLKKYIAENLDNLKQEIDYKNKSK